MFLYVNQIRKLYCLNGFLFLGKLFILFLHLNVNNVFLFFFKSSLSLISRVSGF